MNKKKISALLAEELVRRSPKLKPLYINEDDKVVFNAEDEVQVAEVLMKVPGFFKQSTLIASVQTLSEKSENKNFNALALKFFQKKLSFKAIVAFYSKESTFILKLDQYQIEEFFCKMSGCKRSDLAKPIACGVISRPMLIDLVEALEYLTGRPLSSENNQPLAYLDESASYKDIASYFSIGSEKINEIRIHVLKAAPPTQEQLVYRFRANTAIVYSQQVGYEKVDDDFLALKVKELHPVEFGPNEWDLAIAWTEDELEVQVLDLLSSRITDESTVNDLLDLFCEVYQNKM